MAAHFHTPHPTRRPHRASRPGTPALTLVPAALAAVLPIPRPAARPTRLVLLTCPPCDLAADPMPAADAEQAAGAHDDHHHDGTPTATLHTVHTPGSTRPAHARSTAGRPGGGPDLGGAA